MKKRNKRKKVNFNPTHEDIAEAIEEFLKKGGQIQRIEPDNANPKIFKTFIGNSDTCDVDKFLLSN